MPVFIWYKKKLSFLNNKEENKKIFCSKLREAMEENTVIHLNQNPKDWNCHFQPVFKILVTGYKIPKLNLEIWNLQGTNVLTLSSIENLYAKGFFNSKICTLLSNPNLTSTQWLVFKQK